MSTTTFQRYLISSIGTFITTFLITVGLQLQAAGHVTMTGAVWLPIGATALRAAIKAGAEAIAGFSGDTPTA